MKRTKKMCKGFERDPHEDYLWAHGLCKMCDAKKRNKNAPEKQRGIKITRAKPIKSRTKKNIEEKKLEMAASKSYWELKADAEGLVRCEETGEVVGRDDEHNHALVCHIYSKGANKAYQADMRNFIILKYDLHIALDNEGDAHLKLPNTWDRIQETKRKLKLEYHERN